MVEPMSGVSMRVVDFFDRAARQHAGRMCLVDEERGWTFRQVQARTASLARTFGSDASGPRLKIGILAPNCADAVIAILAVFRAGCVWVPANSRATAEELATFLALVECDLLLVHQSLMELGRAAVRGSRCRLLDLPRAEDLAEEAVGDEDALPYAPEDVCSVFGTGGTTGSPKAALWSHRTWSTLIANFHAGIRHDGPPVHLVAAPFTHAAGVISMPLMAIGATTVLVPRAEPELVMRTIAQHRVTTLFLPPTVIYTLLAHPDVRRYDYGSLQNFIYAAAPMSVDKLKEAMEVFGPVMVQTFGQAEAPMVCTILGRHEHLEALQGDRPERLASCGRPGLLTELAVLDDDGGPLPGGETGEIAVRGDLVMAGYMNNPEATAASRVGGWHLTGDIGRVDDDGFVYITDRKRDMIISGGFNVFPSEIEQLLWSHPAVRDCAVIGCPDPKWGEAVVAVVELKPDADCDEATLIALCKSRLGSVKSPKRIEFWRELPRSSVGKVLKRAVRDRFWAGRERRI